MTCLKLCTLWSACALWEASHVVGICVVGVLFSFGQFGLILIYLCCTGRFELQTVDGGSVTLCSGVIIMWWMQCSQLFVVVHSHGMHFFNFVCLLVGSCLVQCISSVNLSFWLFSVYVRPDRFQCFEFSLVARWW